MSRCEINFVYICVCMVGNNSGFLFSLYLFICVFVHVPFWGLLVSFVLSFFL